MVRGGKFVIQEHFTEPHHYDLMLDAGEALWTWSVFETPDFSKAKFFKAKRIGDHRKIYLEYEGKVSGNRGHVKIWDKGGYEFEQDEDGEYIIWFSGRNISGRFGLFRKTSGDAWWAWKKMKTEEDTKL